MIINTYQFMYAAIFACCVLVITSIRAADINENEIVVDGVSYYSVELATKAIKNNSKVYLGPGEYHQGMHIKANNVTISGSKGTHFIGAEIDFKGTFVVSGENVRIENIECSEVKGARNAACIRHQGKNLTVSNVYFHDSHQGILEAPNDGFLKIEYSRFERLGLRGRAHGIYTAGRDLLVNRCKFNNMIKQGHAIKSRSLKTVVTNSVISSGAGDDSRLVDIPNGGEIVIENNILHQGPNSVNMQVIGFGLENRGRKRTNSVIVRDNLVILERKRGNEFFAFNNELISEPIVEGNILIGPTRGLEKWLTQNTHYESRAKAGIIMNKVPEIESLQQLLLFLHRD